MTAPISRRKRRTPSLKETNGITFIEILIALAVAGIVVTLALGLTLSSRRLLQIDQVRTGVNQSLRGALEIIGSDVRLAGEGYLILSSGLSEVSAPAIEIEDNILIIRRIPASSPPALRLCDNISQNTSSSAQVGRPNSQWGEQCEFQPSQGNPAVNLWRDYADGGTIEAYIHQGATGVGECFEARIPANSNWLIHRAQGSGSWKNSYGLGAEILPLNEHRYVLDQESKQLQRIGGCDEENPIPISGDINTFEVWAIMADGSRTDTLSGNDWTDVQAIELSINGNIQSQRTTVERTLTSKFFPRNILSRSDN